MIPVQFNEQNYILEGGESYIDLPIFSDGTEIISKWKLNKEELEIINKTGEIYLRVMGSQMPPLRLSVYNPFYKPKPIEVNKDIADRICIMPFEGEEFIFVKVQPDYYDFSISKNRGKKFVGGELKIIDVYSLTFKSKFKIHKKINYDFLEPVELIGLAKENPEYSFLFDQYHIDKNDVLILKRKNISYD